MKELRVIIIFLYYTENATLKYTLDGACPIYATRCRLLYCSLAINFNPIFSFYYVKESMERDLKIKVQQSLKMKSLRQNLDTN